MIGDQGTSPWLSSEDAQAIRSVPTAWPSASTRSASTLAQPAPPDCSTSPIELPAAVLARMLGIHIKVAVAWQHASAGDWMTYAADVSRRSTKESHL